MRFRSMTFMAVLAAVVLLAAACGGGDDSDGSAEPAASNSDGSAESTSSTTTAAIPEGGASVEGIQLSAVVFGDAGHVTVTNTSAVEVNLDGLWLCNRPAYTPLTGSLAPDASIEIPATEMGGLSADGGEAGLYSSRSFDSSEAMIDYVAWGSGGGRAGVAVDAGLWPEGVTVSPTAELIELFGAPGDPEAWS